MNTESNIPQDIPDEGPAETRPLGFWLKAVGALVDREMDAALRGEAVDRRDWRLLKALDGAADTPWLHERMARKPRRIEALTDRGWATRTDGEWTLTDDGRAAVERLTAKVAGVRERVSGAVPPEELTTTIASLEAIARELGWEEGRPLPRHGRRRRDGLGHGGFGPRDGHAHRHGLGAPGFGGHGRRGFDPGDAGRADGPCGRFPDDHDGHRHGRHDGFGPWARGRHDVA
ncbi:hypothetical protein N8K70_15700 [Microbacterium betulae]|uniref:Uncharacterized protein n=1 Tax=Microbacterium betulae TaxID=2981139 RepID=A0AA97FHK4_9MICO|nr:hypothetical protein [Microbacterium sp. AB]WOF22818.1 hypothetical protein N8K70_15700 [Microbacterium sp. AB]